MYVCMYVLINLSIYLSDVYWKKKIVINKQKWKNETLNLLSNRPFVIQSTSSRDFLCKYKSINFPFLLVLEFYFLR